MRYMRIGSRLRQHAVVALRVALYLLGGGLAWLGVGLGLAWDRLWRRVCCWDGFYAMLLCSVHDYHVVVGFNVFMYGAFAQNALMCIRFQFAS